MADAKAQTRCRCGHHRLRHKATGTLVCPACDLVAEWPRWRKGSWTPV